MRTRLKFIVTQILKGSWDLVSKVLDLGSRVFSLQGFKGLQTYYEGVTLLQGSWDLVSKVLSRL